MSFIRLLFLFACGYFLIRFLFKFLVPSGSGQTKKPATPNKQVGHLVRCDQCNTLIPPEAALQIDRQTFCSESCRVAAQNKV